MAKGVHSLCVCGGIYRNEAAEHVRSFVTLFGERILTAEVNAIMLTFELHVDRQWKYLWPESDFIMVVNAFSNLSLVHWRIIIRWLKCLAITYFISFMISHVFREGNGTADSLANI